MKQKASVILRSSLITMIIIFVITMTVSAAPSSAATSKNLSTNYTLVNLGSSEATVVVDYYKSDGTPWPADAASTSFTIPANFGQKIVAQYVDSTMTSGQGSAVISSDAPLGAVVQILARNQTPTQGAYTGITAPSNKFYVPLVQRKAVTGSGLSSSQIVIQNAETTATQVTIQLIANPNVPSLPSWTKPAVTIQPGATYYYDLSDESASNIPDNWAGSAVVTAEGTKKIGVVVNLFSGANTLQTYNAFAQEAVGTSWSIPLFNSRNTNGLNSPVAIQNISGSEIAIGGITMSCTSSISTPATFSISNTTAVVNNAAYYFNPVVDMTIPTNWSGSCLLDSPGKNVAVFVQMRRPGRSDEAAAYEAFLTSGSATSVVVPLVSKHQDNGFATAVTIQNLDPVNAAQVTLTYTPGQGYSGSMTPVSFDATIPAGGNLVQNHRFGDVTQIPDKWFGTLKIVPKSGSTPRPIVAFVQLTNWKGVAGDTLMAHGAIPLP